MRARNMGRDAREGTKDVTSVLKMEIKMVEDVVLLASGVALLFLLVGDRSVDLGGDADEVDVNEDSALVMMLVDLSFKTLP